LVRTIGSTSDLATNSLRDWREQHPTFAQIECGEDDAHGEVHYFWSRDKVRRVPDGILKKPVDD